MLVAIRSVNGERVPKMMKWGLIPHWAKDDKLQYSTFNARAEEFTTKPAFRDAWQRGQRCLVVTDGSVVEMEIADERRRGFKLNDFDVQPEPGDGRAARPYAGHPAENDWPKWLGEEPASEQELLALLKPCPDEALEIWPVDKMVGNVRNNGPQLILPVLSNPQ